MKTWNAIFDYFNALAYYLVIFHVFNFLIGINTAQLSIREFLQKITNSTNSKFVYIFQSVYIYSLNTRTICIIKEYFLIIIFIIT